MLLDGVDPKMRHRDPEKEDVMMTRAALAMVENIDWNVGRLLAALDQSGLVEDTIVGVQARRAAGMSFSLARVADFNKTNFEAPA